MGHESKQTSTVDYPNNTLVPKKGGWGWCILPVVLMFIGSYIAWAFFWVQLRDPALAGQESFSIAPLTWSVLQAILFLIAYIQLRRLGISVKEIVGLSREKALRDIGVALGLAVVSSAIIAVSQKVMSVVLVGNMGGETGGEFPFRSWAVVWWTTVGAITAGLGEETYFRGFLMERLRWLKPIWLIVASSLAFAFWHLSPFMLLHTFVIGVVFAVVYWRTRRLFPVILAHTLTNVIGGISMLFS